MSTVLRVQPHQLQVLRDVHLPAPADYTVSDTNQGAIILLDYLGSVLARVELSVK